MIRLKTCSVVFLFFAFSFFLVSANFGSVSVVDDDGNAVELPGNDWGGSEFEVGSGELTVEYGGKTIDYGAEYS